MPAKSSTNWEDYCHKKKYQEPPRQLNDHKLDEYQSFFQDEPPHQIYGSVLNETACELFYKIADSEQGKSRLPDNRRRIRNLQDNNLECFAEVTLEFLDNQSKLALKLYSLAGVRKYQLLSKRHGYDTQSTADIAGPLLSG